VLAGRRVVGPHEGTEEAEVFVGTLGGDGDDGQVEVATDDLGDVPERHTFVSGPVQARASRRRFQRQPIQARRIMCVHARPLAVGGSKRTAGISSRSAPRSGS
jgi:hypothetical protein